MLGAVGGKLQHWIEEAGYKVPEGMGYADLDIIDGNRGASGIHQCRNEIAVVAVELVSTLLQSHTKGLPARAYRIDVEGKWIEGETLCPQYA